MANGQDREAKVTHVYTLKRMLFSRGIAHTYLAHDEHLEDEVLIERVERPFDPEEGDWLRQYRTVAVKVMRLRHPNHIAVRDFWTDYRTEFFLVKQYDAGAPLDVLLSPERASELSPARRAAICKDLLRGLAALHAQGVLHRDVKPYGVYVSQGPDGRAQLDHFHLAVSAADVYLDDQLCGTPVYMAPELLRDSPCAIQPAKRRVRGWPGLPGNPFRQRD
jgi:serine/threonine protein kinase